MKVNKKAAFAALCLSLSSLSHATNYVFRTGDSLAGSEIGTLTIVHDGSGENAWTKWTLTAAWDILAAPQAFIHSLTYDYSGTTALSPLGDWTVSPETANVGLKSVNNNGVYFESRNTNNGDLRFIPPESVSWVFRGTTTDNFSNLVAHVSAVSGSDAKFSALVSPVPEPGTWGMLISGLGILSLIARRKSTS